MISPALFSSKKTWYKWTYDVKRKEMEKVCPLAVSENKDSFLTKVKNV